MNGNTFPQSSTPWKKLIIWILAILIILGVIVLAFYLSIREHSEPIPEGDLSQECGMDAFNCDDFSTQSEAQQIFELCGGVDNDIHRLDADGNGVACEGLN